MTIESGFGPAEEEEESRDIFLGFLISVGVAALFSDWAGEDDEQPGARSSSVARHNVMSSTAVGTHEAALQSGVLLEKEWLSMQDNRVREAHALADGQITGSESPYIVGGEELQYPRDPGGSIENIANCRCQELFSPIDTMVTPQEVEDEANRIFEEAKAAEAAVTARMRGMSGRVGGRMEGLEFKIKKIKSLKRKIAGKVKKGGPGMSASQAAGQIQDSLRYTMVLEEKNFADGMIRSINELKAQGFTVNKAKKYWLKGNSYMGSNYTFNTPEGFTFELQFHTPASFAVKEPLLHGIYDKWRVLKPETVLAQKFDAEMRAISAEVPFPPRLDEIPGTFKMN